ncbi:hypothetical protein EYF80_019293 [Liparis tanakae]|uniref:Uncharacterized protein n=1 Tax=Liparis tanakae TaxID=230148 RepID=A0A4Z2HY16_9TELE|nr:hypothetical protein EYF80_019293 [Liparis tanakae]
MKSWTRLCPNTCLETALSWAIDAGAETAGRLYVILIIHSVIDKSVIVQIIIYNGSLSLGGHLKTSPLAKGGEGIVDIQLASLCCGPQGAKA